MLSTTKQITLKTDRNDVLMGNLFLTTIQGLYYLYYAPNDSDNNTVVCENAVPYAVLGNVLESLVHFVGLEGAVRYTRFGKPSEARKRKTQKTSSGKVLTR